MSHATHTDPNNLVAAVRTLKEHPTSTALLWDIDGTLAPIVSRIEAARVPEEASKLLGQLVSRFRMVGCLSGRQSAEAKRLVGVGGLVYGGSHGLELLRPGDQTAAIDPEAVAWRARLDQFVKDHDTPELRAVRARIEDKDLIKAFHWRGAPDERAAELLVERIAAAAERAGFAIHHARKVIEIRPNVPFDKGRLAKRILLGTQIKHALYAGDDRTDLDVFRALAELRADGDLDSILRVGVQSPEGPAEIVSEADLVVNGTAEVVELLRELAS